MGVYSLDFAFGTQPSPGGGLEVLPDHARLLVVRRRPHLQHDGPQEGGLPVRCSSPASGTENLFIPAYAHALVMGVNKDRVPGHGGAFFVHTTNGGPTAGCVALDDATLVKLIQWLKPGAVIAIAQ